MCLIFLKIGGKVYFDMFDTFNEVDDYIKTMDANNVSKIEYLKSVVIFGDSKILDTILNAINERFYLHIVRGKIDEQVYKDLVAYISSNYNTQYGIKVVYGVDIVNIEENMCQKITKTDVHVENRYDVYMNIGDDEIVISLDRIDGKFNKNKSFKQTYANFDEAAAVFYGFKYDLMEIIVSETDKMIVVKSHFDEVIKLFEQKLLLMVWKDVVSMHNGNGKIKYMGGVDVLNDGDKHEYLTAPEVMKKLRISDQTLANWRKNNQVDFKKISNRKFLYSMQSINDIFENGIIEKNVIKTTNNKNTKDDTNYELKIHTLLRPLTFKVPEFKYKKQNFFLNFGNIGITSSPQVMINNNYQLVDFIKKTVICEDSKDLYFYLENIFKDGREPRIDTSKNIPSEFSKFYLNKLYHM
jgi:hypothetical protein